ncbi:hypothetical protein [Methanosarcina mazei]|uniref:Uncharacterized protein n=2 Tax=Methanosarcina mazei TaxID=2209 RepID=A0A0F8PW44_METMZ|nr:hypothetical protein [Methanosarcina mazei]AGF96274.1 hypothetical protein MmTuc01_0871 [Methanosarcina mazei Tuc01]KKG03694.1 hypothetical protein DU47_09045 [Methanosarcina mazei]KKG32314.1 hypothetical protein DU30_11305 [Methanosarcina mazei]KKG58191.1 hypothetical protein DU33_14995 [Methanosarcina mazei]KKG61109.1 hypothetical protein DU67_16105 [Methanosarcina mazei]
MKRSRSGYFVLLCILIAGTYFLLTPAFAHIPVFEGGGKSPETATHVENPEKSRVLYGQLSEENIHYYSFEVEKGERILLGFIVPAGLEGRIYDPEVDITGAEFFTPDLILMGPGLSSEGEVPENTKIPEGYGVKVFPGKRTGSAIYEGFSPSAFYSLAREDFQAPESGTYYAAVSSAGGEGNYGVVLGYRERFSLSEWLSIPLRQIKTYRWEGQSLLFIFLPLGMTLAAGIMVILHKKEDAAEFNPARWAGLFSGLFFLGTGFSLIFQMLYSLSRSSYSPEVIITVFLALASSGFGVIALVLSMKDERYGEKSTQKRLYFFVLGLAGLLFWAGWILGPILAFEAAVLPWKRKG